MNVQHSSDSESDPEYTPTQQQLQENGDLSEEEESDFTEDEEVEALEDADSEQRCRKKFRQKGELLPEKKKVKIDFGSVWESFQDDCRLLATRSSVMDASAAAQNSQNGVYSNTNGLPFSPASSTSSFDDYCKMNGSQDPSGKHVSWADTVPDFAKPPRKVPGLSAVLKQLEKKNRFNVFEKSKSEWDKFKYREGIADSLRAHNKGKNGYIEKQQFLLRTDLRRFEIEKRARNYSRRRNI